MQEIQLLKVIEQDARISVTDLADILNSTPEQVDGGMKKLAEEKVICGYHTVINWDKTNQDHVMALIEVNASPERDCGYDKVAEKIYRYPEVSNMYLISGRSEFIVIVKGRTMREVADFVGQKLAPIEGVKGTATYFVLKQYKVEGVIIDQQEDDQERLLVTP